MEARITSAALAAVALLSLGAGYRTENFLVTASSQELAREVAETAETMRRELAIEWLGHEVGPWQDICPITVHNGPHLGAGGATSFMFDNGRPFGWTMTIQGSRQRILDSVLPHEITHTIFATHFGRPLPRWADEGACTTVEDISERQKQHDMLYEFLTTHRGIAFNEMFAMKEYPSDVLPLYSQGYSLARFFIAQGGKRKFVDYVGDGMKWNNWTKATQKHYGYRSLSELQITWLDWVRHGSRDLPQRRPLIADVQETPDSQLVAVNASDLQRSKTSAATTLVSHEEPSRNSKFENASGGGWYSRVRDETIASRTKSAASTTFAKQSATSRPPREASGQSQIVSRPQPVGRPSQIILEWSQPPPPPQHRIVPAPRGTLWR